MNKKSKDIVNVKLDNNRPIGKRTDYVHQIRNALITDVFPEHIGKSSGITTSNLFHKLFHDIFPVFKNDKKYAGFDPNNNKHYLLWLYTREAMWSMRKHTYCFVVNEYDEYESEYVWFVAKDITDADQYVNKIDNTIKSLKRAKNNVYRAVKEEWWKKDWSRERNVLIDNSPKAISETINPQPKTRKKRKVRRFFR